MAQLLPGLLTAGQQKIQQEQSIFQWLFAWAFDTFLTLGPVLF
ncbi:MAG: hypothetical protein WCB94_17370 [Terriglobales bacterium]